MCARAIVKWACPFFDPVSVVPWEHTVLPYGMVCANRLVRCAEVVAPYDISRYDDVTAPIKKNGEMKPVRFILHFQFSIISPDMPV